MRLLSGLVALAAILALLAGCVTTPSSTSTSPAAPAGQAVAPVPYVAGKDGALPASAYPGQLPVFAERYVGERGGGEPTIGVNADGVAIFPTIAFDINAVATRLPSTRVMISTDEGKSWEDRTPLIAAGNDPVPAVRPNPASLDPYVYADPVTGRLFNIDLNLAAGGFLSYTDDAGKTWVSNPGCCGLPVDDHQSLFAGPATTLQPVAPLYPRILYFCINQVGATSCTHSLDGGLSWSGSVPAYPGAETARPDGKPCTTDPNSDDFGDCVCGGLSGHGHASEKTGTVFVPKGQCGKAEVARSTDNGATFTQVIVDQRMGMPDHEAIVSTDKAGNVYYVFLDGHALPRLAISHDDGVTWSSPINVTVPGVTSAKFPSIVAGDTGRIAFLYLGTTTPHGRHVGDLNGDRTPKYPGELENATWNAYVGFSLNADAQDPVFATVTANPVGDPLARGACAGRCPGSDNGGMYDFLDIDIHPKTGQVWVALMDNCNGETPYNSPPCNGPLGNAKSYQHTRAAVGVQVGGTMLGSALP
jgi:hypothetical protein